MNRNSLVIAMACLSAVASGATSGRQSTRAVPADAGADSGRAASEGAIQYLVAERVPSRFAWGDYDNDGFQDLFLIDGSGGSRLLRNVGDGSVEDVTKDAGLDSAQDASLAAWQDLDGDGHLDLLVAGPAGHQLFRGASSRRFEDVTEASGLAAAPVGSLRFFDYDRDGLTDLWIETPIETFLYRSAGRFVFERVLQAEHPGPAAPLVAIMDPEGRRDGETSGAGDAAPIDSSPSNSGSGTSSGAQWSPRGTGIDDRASSVLCAGSLQNAAGGACLEASSDHELGKLFPLSSTFFIDGDNVGIGTLTPEERLHVAGVVRSTAVSVDCPSGTLTLNEDTPTGTPSIEIQHDTAGNSWVIQPGVAPVSDLRIITRNGTGTVRVLGGNGFATDLYVERDVFVDRDVYVESDVHVENEVSAAEMILEGSASDGSDAWRMEVGQSGDLRVIGHDDSPTLRVLGSNDEIAGLYVEGDASVATLTIRGGADLVEGFETREEALEPGTVVVIDSEHPGCLRRSTEAYDRRVAGVVSGAGGVLPGLRMGQEGVMDGETLVAMTGRVYVRCSTENGSIVPGDRLTTSGTAGYAMKATDAGRSDGAVIGKAVSSLAEGDGLVLVLVNLQ